MTDYPPSPIRYPLVLDYTSIMENKPIQLTVTEALVYVVLLKLPCITLVTLFIDQQF